ncbi:hypothetical protein TRIP_C20002 [Candidatus Zixiibacteriota bacterium]|nr:hypothetical protein TRIP_C20002 [candidate division Zixibacteria bacterium]
MSKTCSNSKTNLKLIQIDDFNLQSNAAAIYHARLSRKIRAGALSGTMISVLLSLKPP